MFHKYRSSRSKMFHKSNVLKVSPNAQESIISREFRFQKTARCRLIHLVLLISLGANYRLYRCSVLIEMLILVKYRLCTCSVVIKMLLLASYRLFRCNVVIVILMLVIYRLCRCSIVIEIFLLANYRLCKCSVLIEIIACQL